MASASEVGSVETRLGRMNLYEPSDSDKYQAINRWEDVETFAGKIVAIKETHPFSCYFSNMHYAFQIDETSFAYVTRYFMEIFSGGPGYYLNLLYKNPIKCDSATIVNEQTLYEHGPLFLREASSDEMAKIKDAVDNALAVFSVLFCREAQQEANIVLCDHLKG